MGLTPGIARSAHNECSWQGCQAESYVTYPYKSSTDKTNLGIYKKNSYEYLYTLIRLVYSSFSLITHCSPSRGPARVVHRGMAAKVFLVASSTIFQQFPKKHSHILLWNMSGFTVHELCILNISIWIRAI